MTNRSAGRAALLSLLLPGLGQLYLGRRRRALAFLLPIALVAVGAAVVLAGGMTRTLALVLQPTVFSGLLAGLVGLLAYHLAAIVDAYQLARASAASGTERPRPTAGQRTRAAAPLALALVVVTLLYSVPLYVGVRAAPNLARLFGTGEDIGSIVAPSWEQSPSPDAPPGSPAPSASAGVPGTSGPSATAAPTAAPTASPFTGPEWARDGRLNIVLLGADEGPGRWSLRTDAVFLLSIDVASGRSAVFGFPRYMSNIPLPPASAQHWPGGRYPKYLNALYVAGLDFPRKFPDNDERGLGIVAAAVQEMAGVRVDHYLMANLNGFVDLVDAMGGLWIDVPEPGVVDDRYPHESGTGPVRIRLDPGCQLLDGHMALAFSRSRHQDSDTKRLGRQTVTIAALRRQFDPMSVLPRVPDLFDVAGENIYWTLTPEDAATIAQLASRVDADEMQRILFSGPEWDRELPGDTVDRIRERVRTIFDEPGPAATPTPSPSPGGGPCPP